MAKVKKVMESMTQQGPFTKAIDDVVVHTVNGDTNLLDCPGAFIQYVVDFGVSQGLFADPVAGLKKEMTDAGKTEQEIEKAMHDARVEKHTRAWAGFLEYGSRGPQLPTVEQAMRDIVDMWISIECKKKGVKMLSGDSLKVRRKAYLNDPKLGGKARQLAEAQLAVELPEITI